MENIDCLGGRVFNRIILDEAEKIADDHSDNPFWMRLRGLIRWAHIASLPPIPNLGDPRTKKTKPQQLFNIIRFLRLKPFHQRAVFNVLLYSKNAT